MNFLASWRCDGTKINCRLVVASIRTPPIPLSGGGRSCPLYSCNTPIEVIRAFGLSCTHLSFKNEEDCPFLWRATKIQPPMPCDSSPRAAGAMPAECALDVCYGCMEKNKKSPRWGCEGWRPFVGVMSKSNVKQAPPLSFAFTPSVARHSRHSPPSPLRKKSRLAKKKSATPKKNTPTTKITTASCGR